MGRLTSNHRFDGDALLERLYEFISHTEVKRLVNQIISAQSSIRFRSVAVLSEYKGEGKTFFTAALALAYARFLPGRVLIVNTIPQSAPSEALLRSVIGVHRPVRGRFESSDSCRVDLITAKENVRERWAESPDFQISSYIDKFADNYDIVFVDTCSMSLADDDFIDPIVIAKHIDTSILITSQKSMDRVSVRNIMGKLRRYGIRPLGAVYNAGVMNGWMSRQ